MTRSILCNVFLKEDKETDSLMVLGITPQILGPKYRSECLPQVTVLNLGTVKSLFRSK